MRGYRKFYTNLLLYHSQRRSISFSVSYQFANEIDRAYNSIGFSGRLARQLFQPPQIIRTPEKLNAMSPAARRQLDSNRRPRLCLRYFASYETLGYIFAAYLLLYVWFRLDILAYLLLLVLSLLMYYVGRALFSS